MKRIIRVLIMEDPVVIPVVIQFLEHVAKADKIHFDILVAPSPLEARLRLLEVDMAIIGIEFEGREIARLAVNEVEIPVIAMSIFPQDLICESNNLRFIAKPAFKIEKFTDAVRDFVAMVQNGELPAQQFTAMILRFFQRNLEAQVPANN